MIVGDGNWLRQAIEVDGNGFVKTGLQIAESWLLRRQPFLLETSLPGIFAAGDVRCGSTKRVASAAVTSPFWGSVQRPARVEC